MNAAKPQIEAGESPAPERAAPMGLGDGVLFGLLALAFVWLFASWFKTQAMLSWDALDDWGHAFVVPGIAGWMVWQHRKRIKVERIEVFWPALAPLLLGIMSYFFCVVQVRNHMLQGGSMLLVLFSVVVLLLGPTMLRWLFLPIVYLVFMITIAERIMLAVTFKLQLVASQGAWLMLNAIGQPFGWFSVDIEGNMLSIMPSNGHVIPLSVAEACSGMRMVVAFIALAGFVALISTRIWWQRIILLLVAAPVAIFMNVVRVAVLGLLSLWEPDLASGDAHTIIGTLLLFPALLLYLGIVGVLNKIVNTPAAHAPDLPIPVRTGRPQSRRTHWIAGFVALVVLAGSAAGIQSGIKAMNIHLRKMPIYPPQGRQVSQVPVETANWERFGTDRVESSEVVETMGTDNYLSRTYVLKNPGKGGQVGIELHLAYYTGMIDTVPHIPERCFIGGGLQQTKGAKITPLPMDTTSWLSDPAAPGSTGSIYTQRLSANPSFTDSPGRRVRLPRGVTPESPLELRVSSYDAKDGRELYAGYCFIANGGTVPSAEGVRSLAFDLTSDYAFYLKVQVNCSSVASSAEFAEYAGSLLGELFGEIMRCVPDWVEVQQGRYPDDNPRRLGADTNES